MVYMDFYYLGSWGIKFKKNNNNEYVSCCLLAECFNFIDCHCLHEVFLNNAGYSEK